MIFYFINKINYYKSLYCIPSILHTMNHSVFLGILKLHADAPQQQIPIESIKNLIPSDQLEIIKMLLSNFINNIPVIHKDNINYKMKYYYNILIFIVNVINNLYTLPNIELYNNIILKFINNRLLYKLCAAYNGNQILEKLNVLTNIKEINSCKCYIYFTATCGTFETFVWWINFVNNTKYIIYSRDLIKRLLTIPFKGKMFIDDLKSSIENVEELFIQSFNNSDNRLLRFFLQVNKINLQINFTDKLIKDILNVLNSTTFEPKYILKRLKLLSQNTNISSYFPYIIKTFVSVPVILKLHTLEYYYNIPHTLDNITQIMLKIQLQNTNIDTWYYEIKNNVIPLFKTSTEQKIASFCNNIILVIKDKFIREIKYIDKLNFIEIYKSIIKMIKWYHFDYILNSDMITTDSKLYTHIQSKLNATIQLIPLINKNMYEVSFNKINNALCILSRAMRNNYWFKYNNKLNNELNKRSHIISALKDRWYYLQFNNFIKKQYIILDNSYKLKKNMYLSGDLNLMSTIVLDNLVLPTLPVIMSSYIIKIIEFKVNNPINSENITIYGIIDIDIPDTTYNTRIDMLLDACPHTILTKHTDSLESYIKEIEKDYENMKDYAIKYENVISFLWWPIVIRKYTGLTIDLNVNKMINMSLPTYYQKIIPISSLP